jgi:D-lyxose ketol-isomerase
MALKTSQVREAQGRALEYLDRVGIALTPDERDRIEIAEFGLNHLDKEGLEILTYVNTARCCAKELVMFPGQTCPEHRHPAVDGQPGKEETFRCRWGTVYLYVPGSPTPEPHAVPPGPHYTVFHEVALGPGDQYTLSDDTLHWFQAGPEGAIISEFSTTSRDESDLFTDPNIQRIPEILPD